MSQLAEERLAAAAAQEDPAAYAQSMLGLAEDIIEGWIIAQGRSAEPGEREGFRLLELHRQAAHDLPSFNACRETCREVCYHFNLLTLEASGEQTAQLRVMLAMLVRHLDLFVSGKREAAGLGEFCCASRPLRLESPAG
jgi:hypothetical protein